MTSRALVRGSPASSSSEFWGDKPEWVLSLSMVDFLVPGTWAPTSSMACDEVGPASVGLSGMTFEQQAATVVAGAAAEADAGDTSVLMPFHQEGSGGIAYRPS